MMKPTNTPEAKISASGLFSSFRFHVPLTPRNSPAFPVRYRMITTMLTICSEKGCIEFYFRGIRRVFTIGQVMYVCVGFATDHKNMWVISETTIIHRLYLRSTIVGVLGHNVLSSENVSH